MKLIGATIVGEPTDTMRPSAVAVLLWGFLVLAAVSCGGAGASAQESLYPTLHLVIADLSSRPNISALVSYIVARPGKFQNSAAGSTKIRVIGIASDEVLHEKTMTDQSQQSEDQLKRELELAVRDLGGDRLPLSLNAVAGRVRENVAQLERHLNISDDQTRGMKPALIIHLIARDLVFRTRVGSSYKDIRLDRNEPPDGCFRQLGPDRVVTLPDGSRKPLLVFDFVAPGDSDLPTHAMHSVINALLGDTAARMTVLAYRDRLTCIGSGDPLIPRPLDAASGNCSDPGPRGEAPVPSVCISPSSAEGANAMARRQRTLDDAQGVRPQAQQAQNPAVLPPPGAKSLPGSQASVVDAPRPQSTPLQGSPSQPANPPTVADPQHQGKQPSQTKDVQPKATPTNPQNAQQSKTQGPGPQGSGSPAPPEAKQQPPANPPPVAEPQQQANLQPPQAKDLQPKTAPANPPPVQEPKAQGLGSQGPSPQVQPGAQQRTNIPAPPKETSQPQDVRPIAMATRRSTANGRRSQSSLALTAEPTLTQGSTPVNIRPRIVLLPQSAADAGQSWPLPVGIDQRKPPRWAERSIMAVQLPEGTTCDSTGIIGFTFELQGGIVQEEYATYEVAVAGACDGQAGNIPIASFTMRN
jgi:hypothetical protein